MCLKPETETRRLAEPMLFSASLALLATPAFAQSDARDELVATTGVVVAQTCRGIDDVSAPEDQPDFKDEDGFKWRAVPASRLAYFAASHSGELVSPAQALETVRNPSSNRFLSDVLYQLQYNLGAKKWEQLRAFNHDNTAVVTPAGMHNQTWFTREDVVLRCKLKKEEESQASSTGSAGGKKSPTTKVQLRLRGDVDALAATGKKRLVADAATVQVMRSRTFQSDGSRTQNTTLALKGMLGLSIEPGALSSLMVFGGYELNKSRAKPAPTLTPPATERDGDTEIVTLGASYGRLVPIGGQANPFDVSIALRADGTYKFDLVKDSERVEGKVSAGFYTLRPVFGICGLGGYTDFGNGFWSRCDFSLSLAYSGITKHGLLPVTTKDHFGHAGGKFGISLYSGDPGENAAFLSAQYLYMPRIDGDPSVFPDIRQHKVSIGYRWWKGKAYGLEVKGELLDGINPDSFADENTVKVGFGIIF